MNNTLQERLRAVTRLTLAGRLKEATTAIQRVLGGAGGGTDGAGAAPNHAAGFDWAKVVPPTEAQSPAASPMVLDGCVFESAVHAPTEESVGVAETSRLDSLADMLQARWRPMPDVDRAVDQLGRGAFTSGTHTHASLTRSYKLYVPPDHAGQPLPLVVMLHGCTQDPDDFAAGTGMNERAREQGFCVLYPAQAQEANPSRCWNWFKHNHQQRDRGEPALIASMTQAVMKQYGMDAQRVYIAGLSAGGAMAAIVAEAYPEIFAAVGVHSGLARGAASSVPEALAAMKGGAAGQGHGAPAHRARGASGSVMQQAHVPTIVFHGDHDQTVHPRNGEQVIAAALASVEQSHASFASSPRVEQGVSAHGRRYTRSIHHGDKGKALAEHWLVHGAGHAWSGGHANGSYTDAKGPDATSEMLRFFFEHPHKVAY